MNKTITHEFKSRYRTGRMVITEQPDKVLVKLRFSKYGSFRDIEKVTAWMAPIFVQYDADPRPLVIDNPHSGEVATVTEFDGTTCAIVRRCDA